MAAERPDHTAVPWLTADLPGAGGTIKLDPDDFVVEELPRYEPAGQGTHVFFGIEKRGLTTLAALSQIARALGRHPRDIGYAGLKDARVRTRQTLSLEHVEPQAVLDLALPKIAVLWARRHTNKLKLGHLLGNRFDIRIRGHVQDGAARAADILKRLGERGVPNFFGPQRFGAGGHNGRIGRAVLLGDFDDALHTLLLEPGPDEPPVVSEARELARARDFAAAARAWPYGFAEHAKACRALARSRGDTRHAWQSLDPRMRRLFVSATQSELFNNVLARRLTAIDALQDGDLAWKHANGACFLVCDAAAEQPRCTAFEISPSGPLPGPKMIAPEGRPGELEQAVIAASGLSMEHFRSRESMRMPGARRPLRVPLEAPQLDAERDDRGPNLRLRFSLPPGSYATAVTHEVCKAPRSDAPSGPETV